MNRITCTPKEAAEMTGLCKATIFNLLKAKKLMRYKIGTRTLIKVDELNDYIESQSTETNPT